MIQTLFHIKKWLTQKMRILLILYILSSKLYHIHVKHTPEFYTPTNLNRKVEILYAN